MITRKKTSPCYCDGYPFPHREGSLYCRQYEGPRDLQQEYESEQFEQLARELGAVPINTYDEDEEIPF